VHISLLCQDIQMYKIVVLLAGLVVTGCVPVTTTYYPSAPVTTYVASPYYYGYGSSYHRYNYYRNHHHNNYQRNRNHYYR
jgi:hypothetical protein